MGGARKPARVGRRQQWPEALQFAGAVLPESQEGLGANPAGAAAMIWGGKSGAGV